VTEKPYRKLQSNRTLNRLMTAYYLSRPWAARIRPLAWVTSGAPVEILRAMGIATLYPENYGALWGVRRQSLLLCQEAEARGYSPDLCSYARSNLGAVLGTSDILSKLPRPDLLVASNNICGTVIKWYQALAEHFQVPLFVLDTPYLHEVEPLSLAEELRTRLPEHVVQYVAAQLQDLVGWVTNHTGRRLHRDHLRTIVVRSNQAVHLWRNIRDLCQARPSPLNAPDLFITMAPIVVLRGSRVAIHYYRLLKAEVQQRVRNGLGALVQERYRLLWDNIAIWPQFSLFNWFARHGACFVADTYTYAWSLSLEADDPLIGLAKAYTSVYINQSLEVRAAVMKDLITRFAVDGAVFHANRSCKPYSLGQYWLQQVAEEQGCPTLIIEADMCDPRAFASEIVYNRAQAFLETLASR